MARTARLSATQSSTLRLARGIVKSIRPTALEASATNRNPTEVSPSRQASSLTGSPADHSPDDAACQRTVPSCEKRIKPRWRL